MGSSQPVQLNVSIIGAGVAGLATAIALKRKGQNVTVFEANEELSEFGAGIQLTANGTRILFDFDLETDFRAVANQPKTMKVLRWQDGRTLGEIQHNPYETWAYGFPQWQLYRPDIQDILYKGAQRDGITVKFGHSVKEVDTDQGILTFETGESVQSDLIVAADGIRSRARSFLPQTAQVKTTPFKEHCYRTVIPAESMNQDPDTAELMKGEVSVAWVGPECAALGYRVAGGKYYNFLESVPRPNPDAEVARWNQRGDPKDMRRIVKDWCPLVRKVADKVEECAVWTLGEVEKVETYVSDSGRFALIGDAAHAMLPHGGQGGNMALEDAASLAEFVSALRESSRLPQTMQAWFRFRQDRVERVRRIATGNSGALSLPDGEAQERRDAMLAKQTAAWKEELERLGPEGVQERIRKENVQPDPDAESTFVPGARMYVYSYDIFAESKRYIVEHL